MKIGDNSNHYKDFDELHQKIINSKAFREKKSFITKINNMFTNFKKSKINITLFGGVSAGKTTFANILISYFMKNEDFLNFLPNDESENTANLWEIENSEDNFFYFQRNDEKILKMDEQTIIGKIKEINEEQSKKCIEMKKNSSIKGDRIKIQIPEFHKNYRILDCPAISSGSLQKLLADNLINAQTNLMLYFQNLQSAEKITENNINFMKLIQDEILKNEDNYNNPPLLLSFIFTKKDDFFDFKANKFKKIPKNTWIEKKVEDLRKIINVLEDNCGINQYGFYQSYFLNLAVLNMSKGDIDSNLKTVYQANQKILERFVDDLNPLKIYQEQNKPYQFLEFDLKRIINDEEKTFNENRTVDELKLPSVKEKTKKYFKLFEKRIKNFLKNFSDFKKFEKNSENNYYDYIVQIKEGKGEIVKESEFLLDMLLVNCKDIFKDEYVNCNLELQNLLSDPIYKEVFDIDGNQNMIISDEEIMGFSNFLSSRWRSNFMMKISFIKDKINFFLNNFSCVPYSFLLHEKCIESVEKTVIANAQKEFNKIEEKIISSRISSDEEIISIKSTIKKLKNLFKNIDKKMELLKKNIFQSINVEDVVSDCDQEYAKDIKEKLEIEKKKNN